MLMRCGVSPLPGGGRVFVCPACAAGLADYETAARAGDLVDSPGVCGRWFPVPSPAPAGQQQ